MIFANTTYTGSINRQNPSTSRPTATEASLPDMHSPGRFRRLFAFASGVHPCTGRWRAREEH